MSLCIHCGDDTPTWCRDCADVRVDRAVSAARADERARTLAEVGTYLRSAADSARCMAAPRAAAVALDSAAECIEGLERDGLLRGWNKEPDAGGRGGG